MSERASFGEILTYGFRTLFWRPVHSIILIAVASLAMIAYYTWAQSPAGQEFMLGYTAATMDPANIDLGAYFNFMGIMAFGGMVIGAVLYAGIYRLLVRENPTAWLPFQLGRDELNMFLGVIILGIIMIGVMIAAALAAFIVLLVLSFLLAAVLSGNPEAVGMAGGAMAFVVMILLFVPVCYVIGRVSVSLPLSIKERRFSLGGWSASKGMGGSLLGAHILIVVLYVFVQLALSWELMAASFQMGLEGSTYSPEELAQLMANPFGNLIYIAAPIYMVMYIVMLGPTAAIAAKSSGAVSAIEPGARE